MMQGQMWKMEQLLSRLAWLMNKLRVWSKLLTRTSQVRESIQLGSRMRSSMMGRLEQSRIEQMRMTGIQLGSKTQSRKDLPRTMSQHRSVRRLSLRPAQMNSQLVSTMGLMKDQPQMMSQHQSMKRSSSRWVQMSIQPVSMMQMTTTGQPPRTIDQPEMKTASQPPTKIA